MFRPQISHVRWLSYNDVSRWMAEQNKDVQRLCKHIEQMAATIDPLKAEVSAFEKETKEAEARAKQCEKDLKREKETQAAVKKQFEVSADENFLFIHGKSTKLSQLRKKQHSHTTNLPSISLPAKSTLFVCVRFFC